MTPTDADLSGDWTGFYEQGGARCGISMRVVQRGQSFVGTMRDHTTLSMHNVEMEAAAAELAAIGGAVPEVVTTLPEHSTVEGEVHGLEVAFHKRYRGAQQTTVWLGGSKALDLRIEDHCVDYRGALQQNGRMLRGEWEIAGRDGMRGESGAFELRRLDGEPRSGPAT